MIHMGAIWMVVLVTVNRFIAVCKPLHAARLCSIRNVRLQIVGVFVFVVLFNIPRCFEYIPVNVNVTSHENGSSFEQTEVDVGLKEYPAYFLLYSGVASLMFTFVIPLGLVIVLNVRLMLELRRAKKSRSNMVDGVSAQENNITKVVVILILTFIVCEAPAGIKNIVVFHFVFINDDEDVSSVFCSSLKITGICNLLVTTNSSVNFAIYCLLRRKFRKELRSIFCKSGRTDRRSEERTDGGMDGRRDGRTDGGRRDGNGRRDG